MSLIICPTNHENVLSLVRQSFITIGASLVALVVGYSCAYSGTVLEVMDRENETIRDEQWFCNVLVLFAILGALLGGYTTYKIGRKITIMISSLLFVLSYFVLGLCKFKFVLYIGRSLIGLGVGMATLVIPVYLCEITDNKLRGFFVLLPIVFGNIGIVLCQLIGRFFNWKVLSFVGMLPNVLFFLVAFWMPESPRWFIQQGNYKEAYYTLKYVLVSDVLIDDRYVELMIMQVDRQTKKNSWFLPDYFNRINIKSVSTVLCLMLMQQMSGISIVIFFTTKMFREDNLDLDGNLCGIIIGVTNVISLLITLFIINWVGRKCLLYVSNAIITWMLFILGVYYYFMELDFNMEYLTWVPLVCFIVYLVGFNLGMGPLPWLLMGEMMPDIVLEVSAATVTTFSFISSFAVTSIFFKVAECLGVYWIFWIFSISCLIDFVFVMVMVPETKGVSLRNIQRKLSGFVN